jgi:hypothetical protein
VEQLQAELQAQSEELQQLRHREEQVQQQVQHMGNALQIEVSAAAARGTCAQLGGDWYFRQLCCGWARPFHDT